MAQRSFPFDAGAGATISETDWQKMARRFRQTGVIGGYLSQLAASADGSALSVSVATGGAFVEGFYYENDAPLAVPLAAANATNPRIDTIIVRLDRTANTAVLDKVTGTPAASPVAATLSQTDSLYELPLANVLVPAAAGVIVAGNVTDRRSITQTFDSAAYVSLTGDNAAGFKSTRLRPSEIVVDALETTTGTGWSPGDLATVGPVVTITAPPSGQLKVTVAAWASNTDAGQSALMTARVLVDATSAIVVDADDSRAAISSTTAGFGTSVTRTFVAAGLTPGTVYRITAKYRASGGTGRWQYRRVLVEPVL